MTQTIRRLAVAAAMLVLLLTTAGSASAASRSFDIENHTRFDFTLTDNSALRCDHWDRWKSMCRSQKWFPIGYEGRPDIGSVLQPDDKHDFELKYEFSPSFDSKPHFAAGIEYSNSNIGSYVTIDISTSNWGRDSECEVRNTRDADLRCTTNGGGTIRILPPKNDDND